MNKYIKPLIKLIEINSKSIIFNLSSSDNVLNKDNLKDDDPSQGWGSLH